MRTIAKVYLCYVYLVLVIIGYTGDFCEVPMSPCSCVHGRCRASSDGYYCSCFKGYMGDKYVSCSRL